jgi:hypothetical protein
LLLLIMQTPSTALAPVPFWAFFVKIAASDIAVAVACTPRLQVFFTTCRREQ